MVSQQGEDDKEKMAEQLRLQGIRQEVSNVTFKSCKKSRDQTCDFKKKHRFLERGEM